MDFVCGAVTDSAGKPIVNVPLAACGTLHCWCLTTVTGLNKGACCKTCARGTPCPKRDKRPLHVRPFDPDGAVDVSKYANPPANIGMITLALDRADSEYVLELAKPELRMLEPAYRNEAGNVVSKDAAGAARSARAARSASGVAAAAFVTTAAASAAPSKIRVITDAAFMKRNVSTAARGSGVIESSFARAPAAPAVSDPVVSVSGKAWHPGMVKVSQWDGGRGLTTMQPGPPSKRSAHCDASVFGQDSDDVPVAGAAPAAPGKTHDNSVGFSSDHLDVTGTGPGFDTNGKPNGHFRLKLQPSTERLHDGAAAAAAGNDSAATAVVLPLGPSVHQLPPAVPLHVASVPRVHLVSPRAPQGYPDSRDASPVYGGVGVILPGILGFRQAKGAVTQRSITELLTELLDYTQLITGQSDALTRACGMTPTMRELAPAMRSIQVALTTLDSMRTGKANQNYDPKTTPQLRRAMRDVLLALARHDKKGIMLRCDKWDIHTTLASVAAALNCANDNLAHRRTAWVSFSMSPSAISDEPHVMAKAFNTLVACAGVIRIRLDVAVIMGVQGCGKSYWLEHIAAQLKHMKCVPENLDGFSGELGEFLTLMAATSTEDKQHFNFSSATQHAAKIVQDRVVDAHEEVDGPNVRERSPICGWVFSLALLKQGLLTFEQFEAVCWRIARVGYLPANIWLIRESAITCRTRALQRAGREAEGGSDIGYFMDLVDAHELVLAIPALRERLSFFFAAPAPPKDGASAVTSLAAWADALSNAIAGGISTMGSGINNDVAGSD